MLLCQKNVVVTRKDLFCYTCMMYFMIGFHLSNISKFSLVQNQQTLCQNNERYLRVWSLYSTNYLKLFWPRNIWRTRNIGIGVSPHSVWNLRVNIDARKLTFNGLNLLSRPAWEYLRIFESVWKYLKGSEIT